MVAPFLFGKLPAHGDFVARGVGTSAERAWDEWASGEIDAARARLGEAFDAAHDAAPPCGFIVGPGPFGEGWRCGAAAPSVDSAGRRFLLVAGIDGLSGPEAAFVGLATARSAEAVIRTVLVGRLDADASLEALADSAPPAEALVAAAVLAAQPAAGLWWSFGDILPPVSSEGSAAGFVTAALERVDALLKEAA